MKLFCLAIVLGFFIAGASAQGTVNFANGAAGVDAPVKLAPSGAPVEGPAWRAELLLVDADGSATCVGEPIAFATNEVAGYFFGGLVSVPSTAVGQKATFRIRAFQAGGSSEATSNPVSVILGGDKTPPANLVGLQSWTVRPVPQPALRISRSADGIKLSWPREVKAVAVESTGSLTQPNWRNVATPPVLAGEEWTLPVSPGASAAYFRLRLE